MESWVAFEPFRHGMPIKGFTDLGVSGTQEAGTADAARR
jgi:hypothetical protein